MKQILGIYLEGTIDFGLLYTNGATPGRLVGYSDADWADDSNDYKSTSGYLFQIGGTVVTWKSIEQSRVALSNAKAEYMVLASATEEAIWMFRLNSDMEISTNTYFGEYSLAIAMIKNPQYHGRSKHNNIMI